MVELMFSVILILSKLYLCFGVLLLYGLLFINGWLLNLIVCFMFFIVCFCLVMLLDFVVFGSGSVGCVMLVLLLFFGFCLKGSLLFLCLIGFVKGGIVEISLGELGIL